MINIINRAVNNLLNSGEIGDIGIDKSGISTVKDNIQISLCEPIKPAPPVITILDILNQLFVKLDRFHHGINSL